jgi:hypothetical protein
VPSTEGAHGESFLKYEYGSITSAIRCVFGFPSCDVKPACNKQTRCFLLRFLYVCPEPVLAIVLM